MLGNVFGPYLKRLSFASMRKKMSEMMDLNAKSQLTDVILNVVFMEDEGLQERLKTELLKVTDMDRGPSK